MTYDQWKTMDPREWNDEPQMTRTEEERELHSDWTDRWLLDALDDGYEASLEANVREVRQFSCEAAND